jgi:hypothetical protein
LRRAMVNLSNAIHQHAMQSQPPPQSETASQFFASGRGEALGRLIDGILTRMYADTAGDGAILRRAYGEPVRDSNGDSTPPESARAAIREEVYRRLTSTQRADVALRQSMGITVSGSGDSLSVEIDLRRAMVNLSNAIHQHAMQQERRTQQPVQTNPATQDTERRPRRGVPAAR